MHGNRVSSNKEASKVDSGQVVELGVKTGQLPDVVADHMEQTLGHVFFGKLCNSEQVT